MAKGVATFVTAFETCQRTPECLLPDRPQVIGAIAPSNTTSAWKSQANGRYAMNLTHEPTSICRRHFRLSLLRRRRLRTSPPVSTSGLHFQSRILRTLNCQSTDTNHRRFLPAIVSAIIAVIGTVGCLIIVLGNRRRSRHG
jgi:hypothetical protein